MSENFDLKEIILIGGGGHCKSVIDVIEQQGIYKIAGIIDKPSRVDSDVLGYKVIGCDSDLEVMAKKYNYAIVTVGQTRSSTLRRDLFDLLTRIGFLLPSIIAPDAYVSKHSNIGKGVVILHGAVINANASIGDNCIINSKALIEHDCQVNNHCHISTSAVLNGGVIIEEESFIGSGAIIKESTRVIKSSFVKAGSLVV